MTRKEVKVPSSRLSRASKFGGLLAKVATNVAYNGTKQLFSGNKPSVSDLVLTPSNLQKLTNELAAMRGAAMKLGQLLSMDAGELIPPELSHILAKLRDNAHAMPHKQLVTLLRDAWSDNWVDNFAYFNLKPFACASIGQVHIANDDSGKKLAIKLQYPGVSNAIKSDVDNLGRILKLSGLIPKQVDLNTLLEKTAEQLINEANYQLEASYIETFSNKLDKTQFALPNVSPLSTQTILVMSFIEGMPIEQAATLPEETRNHFVKSLFSLFFVELFELKLMQTDPNFANYVFNNETHTIGLLDFGATREISPAISNGYLSLFTALSSQDSAQVEDAARTTGFFKQDIDTTYLEQILALFDIASMPLRFDGEYNFANCTIATKLRAQSVTINKRKDQWHTPPVDALFIHRKIAGLYLIAKRLNAKVNVKQLFAKYAEEAK